MGLNEGVLRVMGKGEAAYENAAQRHRQLL
jgi:hypothetical protein